MTNQRSAACERVCGKCDPERWKKCRPRWWRGRRCRVERGYRSEELKPGLYSRIIVDGTYYLFYGTEPGVAYIDPEVATRRAESALRRLGA